MEIDCKEEILCTSSEMTEAAKVTSMHLLPEKSRNIYVSVYNTFMDWRATKKINSFSESDLLLYFTELAAKYKPSTLWTHYSMLRSTLNINQGVNIENYVKLHSLLKQRSEGFNPKKANKFSSEEINKFLIEACDKKYLAMKVTMIMGIMGACQANEMYNMKIDDLKDLGSAFLVNVPNTKTKTSRKFTITDNFYLICKKYIDLRPAYVTSQVFFLNYQNGKCTSQRIGINKFTKMGRQIAEFLKLPNPEKYSGHSFRRSSATLLLYAGGDMATLKSDEVMESTSVTEGSIEELIKNEISSSNDGSTISDYQTEDLNHISSISEQNIHLDINSLPPFNITHCSNTNITINIYK